MSIPDSRLRGLIRDLTDGLAQQMYLWGRDVRHPEGNALLRSGMQRIARTETGGEGTSLYRLERENGWIELHGFCAGWRPHDPEATGLLYIRRCHRIFLASGQMIPGRYDMSRLRSGSTDETLLACEAFLRWWAGYEQWAARELGAAWRRECWRDYLKLRRTRPWLSPVQALDWLLAFLENPSTQKRPREILRSSHRQLKTEHFFMNLLTTLILSLTIVSASADNTIPLDLKELDSVIYIDGVQASGDQPAGLSMLLNLADAYKTHGLKGTITAVFDDDATPIILGSAAYNTQTKTSDGNPYADTIAGLIERGVVIAVCGNDLASKSLTAENLLPGVKTTPRGILLVAQLTRDGAFCLPTPLPGAQPKD